MREHWKAVQWASILAVTAFVVSVMAGKYALTYAVLVSAFVFGTAYLIGVARFKDRPDEDRPHSRRR
jgi:hypothetical protein